MQLIFSLVVHVVMAVEILFYPVVIRSDDTWVGWRGLAEKMKQIKQAYPGHF